MKWTKISQLYTKGPQCSTKLNLAGNLSRATPPVSGCLNIDLTVTRYTHALVYHTMSPVRYQRHKFITCRVSFVSMVTGE